MGGAHKIRLNDLEKVRINNMDSATGWAEVNQKRQYHITTSGGSLQPRKNFPVFIHQP